MKKLKFFLILTMISALFISCSLLGKKSSGNYSVEGTVTDKSGNALSGVTVSVSGFGSDSTDSNGKYSIEGISSGTYQVLAEKSGYSFAADFKNAGDYTTGNYINFGAAAEKGIVKEADFTGIQSDSITIADVQGSGATSPLTDEDVIITGVVTMVCHKAPHWNYSNTGITGSDVAQYVSEDGFYLEALPEDKDYSGTKSNGIFVDTHNSASADSNWVDGIPTDLEAGDVVTVKGVVAETRKEDRYDSNDGILTRTVIKADYAWHVTDASGNVTAAYPDGVLLTYSETKAAQWKTNHSFTKDGVTYYGEARVLAYDSNSKTPMQDAIDVFETVENMVITIDEPRVIGASYYNTTAVLADNGKDENGNHFRTYNEFWQGDVIQMNDSTTVQDFNEEMIFVDYQATDYKAYACNLAQIGDVLKDGNNEKVFRGVMDYTGDGLYMAHPLNTKVGYYLSDSNATTYLAPYYTNDTEATITSVSGKTIYNQLWSFDTSDSWYKNYSTLYNKMIDQPTNRGAVAERSGSTAFSFDALSIFTPDWSSKSSTTKGYTENDTLTVGSFNLENYDGQGSSNSKQENIALTIKNNMLYPDVMVVVEMGDDTETEEVYTNQDNAWAAKDGCVTAVKNYCGIIDVITKTQNGPQYDFRQIDPKEQDSGGEAGVNIRVGLIYNTERVEFVDNGIETNNYYNTHNDSYSGDLQDESEWPLQTPGDTADVLADINANVYLGDDGQVHLTQSPCYINGSAFTRSRRPLVGEFKSKATGENFFVIACHLSSKRSDYPLYGQIQPPLLLSESGRDKQAQTINQFVQSILYLDPNAKVIVAGDMNDFAYSTPLRILTGQEGNNSNQILWSPEEEFMPKTEQFSYAYEGNLQEIDHIFISKALFEKAETAVNGNGLGCASGEEWKNVCFIPHIDSMFTRNNHYNLSDHDPAVVRIPGVFNEE